MGYGGQGDKIPSGYKKGTLQQFTPEQMQLFQQMFSHVGPGSYLGRLAGGDESLFKQMEGQGMKQFEQLQGQTASRFSGAGMGARRGSGFQNAVNQQTSDFAMNMQQQRQQLQQQAIMELMGLSGQLLGQKPYENFLVQKQQQESSGWGSLAGTVIGGGAGMIFGGPAGAYAGATVGQKVGSMF